MESLLAAVDELPLSRGFVPIYVLFNSEPERLVPFGYERVSIELDAVVCVGQDGDFAEDGDEFRQVRKTWETALSAHRALVYPGDHTVPITAPGACPQSPMGCE